MYVYQYTDLIIFDDTNKTYVADPMKSEILGPRVRTIAEEKSVEHVNTRYSTARAFVPTSAASPPLSSPPPPQDFEDFEV
jgi:hypothetical protein